MHRAVWMIRSTSCGSGRPVAAHIIGNPEAGVIPGMVLISLTRIFPAGVAIERPGGVECSGDPPPRSPATSGKRGERLLTAQP